MRTTNKGIVALFTHIRQDINFALSTVSQFMLGPTKEHMEVLNRILIFENGTRSGIIILKDSNQRNWNFLL